MDPHTKEFFMFNFSLKIIFLTFTVLFLWACESKSNNSQTPSSNELNLQNATLIKTDIYPNTLQDITLSIESPTARSAENNDSTLFFFFALTDQNEENSTIWFDSHALDEVSAGVNAYTFSLSFPSDLNISRYSLEVKMSDSEAVIDTFTTPMFDIQTHDNKPQLEILGLTLDFEYSLDNEYDSLSTFELNTSALTSIITTAELSLPILENNATLDINSFITLRSNIADATNVKISGCMEIGSNCIDIPLSEIIDANTSITDLQEDDNSTKLLYTPNFINEVSLALLPANETQNISLDFHIDKSYLEPFMSSIRTLLQYNPNAPLNTKIIVKVTSDNLSDLTKAEEITYEYPLVFTLEEELVEYLLSTTPELASSRNSFALPSRASSANNECGLKKLSYEKEYEKYKYGNKFGAGAYLLGRAWLDAQGIHAKTYSSIRVKRLSDTKHRILRTNITADIEPSSFEDTGYDVEISSLGKVIYTKSYSMAAMTGLTTPIVTLTTEEEKKILDRSIRTPDTNTTDTNSTDTNTTLISGATVTTEATLLRQKRIKAVKDRLKTYTTSSATNISLINFDTNFRIGKNLERKQTFMFAIIPVVVSAGAEARIGYDMSVRLDGITSITAMVEPNAYIGAYLQAGVGVGVSCCFVDIDYSAGVGGELWLVSERFTNTITASLDFIENDEYIVQLDGNLHENITNYINTMSGNIYAYASYYGPYNFKKPTDSDWKNRTKRKYFANWKGGKYTRTLLDERQTLFSVPLADECD